MKNKNESRYGPEYDALHSELQGELLVSDAYDLLNEDVELQLRLQCHILQLEVKLAEMRRNKWDEENGQKK